MIGAAKINFISKFTSTAVAEVIRKKASIIALGNAQVSTSQLVFGSASALFDGTDDYLQVNSSAFAFGTGNFTIECRVRVTTAKNQGVFHLGDSYLPGSGGVAAAIRTDAGNLGWVLYSSGSSTGTTPAPSQNTWYHIAVVRNSGTTTYYVDGTSVVSRADATNYSASTYLAIGGYYSTGFLMAGNIDEFRVSNTARYTSTFTPTTTPFVNDANTVLLIHADGTDASTYFEDDNGLRTQKAATSLNGALISTAQSKFGGSSAYFDGTNDYLTVATSSDFTFTGDFTLECWVRFPVTPANPSNITIWNCDHLFYIAYYSSNFWEIDIFQGGQNRIATTSSGNLNLTTNTWYHIAYSRSGSTVKVFLDGVEKASGTYASTITTTNPNQLGSSPTYGYKNWYIDEFRISNNARYTAAFTPTTTPFVNDANTLLLLHMDGTNNSTVFRDDNGARAQVGMLAINNAQIDNAQSKFGGTSLKLGPSTADRLDLAGFNAVGTQFTLESWVRITSFTFGRQLITQDNGSSGAQGFQFKVRTDGKIDFVYWTTSSRASAATFTTTGTALSTNTWYHLAAVWTGSTLTIYRDGVSIGSTSVASMYQSTAGIGIGGFYSSATDPMDGWMDEIRISNIARYTSSFTAPTAPFQNDSNTLLLIHADGTDASTAIFDDNGRTTTP